MLDISLLRKTPRSTSHPAQLRPPAIVTQQRTKSSSPYHLSCRTVQDSRFLIHSCTVLGNALKSSRPTPNLSLTMRCLRQRACLHKDFSLAIILCLQERSFLTGTVHRRHKKCIVNECSNWEVVQALWWWMPLTWPPRTTPYCLLPPPMRQNPLW
jgi:hypothetical protein